MSARVLQSLSFISTWELALAGALGINPLLFYSISSIGRLERSSSRQDRVHHTELWLTLLFLLRLLLIRLCGLNRRDNLALILREQRCTKSQKSRELSIIISEIEEISTLMAVIHQPEVRGLVDAACLALIFPIIWEEITHSALIFFLINYNKWLIAVIFNSRI